MSPRQGEPTDDLFRDALDGALEPFVFCRPVRDVEGAIIDFAVEYANAAACRAAGLEDAGGRRLEEVAPALCAPGLFEPYCTVVETGRPLSLDTAVCSEASPVGDKRVRWATEIRATRVGGGLALFYRDVTERKRAHERVAQSEEMLRLLLENVHEYGIGVVDVDGRVGIWNAGAQAITGYSSDEVLGRPCAALYPPDQREEATRDLAAAEREGRLEVEGWRARKDGTKYWASVVTAALRDRAGRLHGYAKITRDLTERRAREVALLDRKIRLRALFDHTFGFIGLLSPEGLLLDANRTALDFVGATREEVVGRPFWETPWWTHSPALQQQLREAIERASRGTFVRYEATHRGADGRMLVVDFTLSPVRDDTGAVVYIVPEGRDITDRKALERMRQEWISVITHDLRQPINGIALQTAVLARTCAPGARESIASIQQGAHRLDRMVRDLLEASRLDLGYLELTRHPTDLVILARRAVEQIRLQSPDHPVRLSTREALPMIPADPDRMEQVLENLLTNAVKYGEAGSEILVELDAKDGGVSLAVTNHGKGIEADELPELFQRFHRTRSARGGGAPGLGLGLYIAKGLVQAHGGSIDVESQPGHTTTFRVVLPGC